MGKLFNIASVESIVKTKEVFKYIISQSTLIQNVCVDFVVDCSEKRVNYLKTWLFTQAKCKVCGKLSSNFSRHFKMHTRAHLQG